MSHFTPPRGLHSLQRFCWTLTACPPVVDPDDVDGPGAVHFAQPADAVSWYLELAETVTAETHTAEAEPVDSPRARFRTHLYPWPVAERSARSVAALAVTTTGEPCWLVTCDQCQREMESDHGALHVTDVDRALVEVATTGWAVRGGRLVCDQCAGRASLAEVLEIEADDRLDPDRRPVDPAQLALPGLLRSRLEGADVGGLW